MTESTIDFPKNSLCPQIWEKVVDSSGINEVWQLKPDIRTVLQDIFQKIVDATKLQFNIIHITGSITSNSYTENADIDMHFLSDQYDADEARTEQINTLIRDAFKYVKKYTPALATIGSHPIEVYFQPNKFQDLMSVGCYDFFKQKWLVGPELTDPSFNPYSEYYQEIQTKPEVLAQQIRNMILSIYEIAVAMKKNIAKQFGNNIRTVLVAKLADVQQLYNNIRQMRRAYGSPTSKKQALEWRASRKWKVADCAFKLFDKYGYIAILKQFIEDYKLIQNSHDVDIEIVEDILGTVKNYINNADKLAEKELFEDDQLDEGAKEAISISLLAALLAIPGIAEAKTIHKEIKKAKMEQRAPVEAVDKLMSATKKIGDYTEAQIANVITRTLYNEAQEDGDKGMYGVASVIFNRADGNVEDFVNVCKKHKQFSCWNKMTANEWNPSEFKVRVSKTANDNETNRKIWEKAKQIANRMVKGKFKPTTTANAYYAPKKVLPDWDKDLINKHTIGSHLFGTLTKHSDFV